MKQRPSCLDVSPRLCLKHTREIEHIAASLQLHAEADGEPVAGVAVKDRGGHAGQRCARQFFEATRQALRREFHEIVDGTHYGTSPAASFRSRLSLNHGRSLMRAGAR